jgi:uncharacterized protein YycO
MKKYYLQLSKSSKWYKLGSPFLMWADGVPFSHCSILEAESGLVFESVAPKSRKEPLEEWLKHNTVVYSVEVSASDESLLWLNLQLGRPYSLRQLVAIECQKLFKRLKIKLVNGDKALICTELMAQFLLRYFGVQFSKDPDIISLRDIYRVLRRLKDEIRQ